VPELATDLLLPELLSRAAPANAAGGNEPLSADYTLPFKDGKDALVRTYEKEYLTRLLARCNGNIARAAREAQLDRKHLYTLLEKYGLTAPGQQ
jgi:DNA-binding NtrC family response regulator